MSHVLIATNNFWVGGRETYLGTYGDYLKAKGNRLSLIASSIFQNTPEANVFEKRWECGTDEYGLRWKRWLQTAETIIAQDRPSLIWAHHFDLLPAWLISRLYGIPLLTTFHGPLIGIGTANDPMQALGMTLAIHRGDGVSGVSEEIKAGINRMNPGKGVWVIANSIKLNGHVGAASVRSRPRNFVLITRPEKLQHMRQAVLLFNAYRKQEGEGKLVIAAGDRPDEPNADRNGHRSTLFTDTMSVLKCLGWKWCYEQGPGFLPSLRHIYFHGYTANARELIAASDVVLGMGRVLLEGLAEGKVCVLVGYNAIHGVIKATTFEQYRQSNFSGRGIQPDNPQGVCNAILDYCRNGRNQEASDLNSVSVVNCGAELVEFIGKTMQSSKITDEDAALAGELARELTTHHPKSESLFSKICHRLKETELHSFYKLCLG